MVAWSQDSHLVSVNRVVVKEMTSFLIDLPWAIFIAPEMLRWLLELSKHSTTE